ncbi:MAG: heme-binding protein [Chromatiales bacterium]|nr:heme-binding protein [Chromatiales bacterium]
MKNIIILLVAALFFSQNVIASEDQMAISIKRLSLNVTTKISQAAIDACRKKGIQIAVTVVDRHGSVQNVMRDTVAPVISLEISRQKAFTAANFGAATSQLAGRASTPIGQIDGLLMSAGGIPIQIAGHLLGGVGVSGAPSGEIDEECAQAGIDEVKDDLEMEF